MIFEASLFFQAAVYEADDGDKGENPEEDGCRDPISTDLASI